MHGYLGLSIQVAALNSKSSGKGGYTLYSYLIGNLDQAYVCTAAESIICPIAEGFILTCQD